MKSLKYCTLALMVALCVGQLRATTIKVINTSNEQLKVSIFYERAKVSPTEKNLTPGEIWDLERGNEPIKVIRVRWQSRVYLTPKIEEDLSSTRKTIKSINISADKAILTFDDERTQKTTNVVITNVSGTARADVILHYNGEFITPGKCKGCPDNRNLKPGEKWNLKSDKTLAWLQIFSTAGPRSKAANPDKTVRSIDVTPENIKITYTDGTVD